MASGAFAAVVACGGPETGPDVQGYRELGSFELSSNGDGKTSQGVYQTIQSSPSPNNGQIQAATISAIIGDGTNGCATGEQCFVVAVFNNTPTALVGFYMGIDAISPIGPAPTRQVQNSDPVPPGVTSPLLGKAWPTIPAGATVNQPVNIRIPNLANYIVSGRYWHDTGEVSHSFSGPTTVTINGSNQLVASVAFAANEFQPGAQVTDVNLSITWDKVRGTCAGTGGTNVNQDETSFTLRSPPRPGFPNGTLVPVARSGLINLRTWSGATHVGFVTTVFDQDAAQTTASPAALPVSGTFRPRTGENGYGTLDSFNGLSPVGNWSLHAGGGSLTPLCVSSFTISIQTQ